MNRYNREVHLTILEPNMQVPQKYSFMKNEADSTKLTPHLTSKLSFSFPFVMKYDSTKLTFTCSIGTPEKSRNHQLCSQ